MQQEFSIPICLCEWAGPQCSRCNKKKKRMDESRMQRRKTCRALISYGKLRKGKKQTERLKSLKQRSQSHNGKSLFFLPLPLAANSVWPNTHKSHAVAIWLASTARPTQPFFSKERPKHNATHELVVVRGKRSLCFLSWWRDEPPAPYTSRTAEPKRCCAQLLPRGWNSLVVLLLQ